MIELLLLAASGAAGAGDPVHRLHELVAEAAGACPEARAGELVVCGRRKDPPYRYRYLPGEHDRFDIKGAVDSVSRERHRLMDVGGAGDLQNACSPVGAAGWTGCERLKWHAAEQQRGFRPLHHSSSSDDAGGGD